MALTRVTSRLVTFIQTATGAASRLLFDKLSERLTFEDFGAKGDGTTDDTAAITAALTHAITNQVGYLRGSQGRTYKVTGSLGIYTPAAPFTLDLNGATIDASPTASGVTILRFMGSRGTYVNLTSSTAIGDNFIEVADTATFSRGKYVKIVSNEVWDPSNTDVKIGELALVRRSENSSTALPATRIPLATGVYSAYLTSDAAKVAPCELAPRVRVLNGNIRGRSQNQNAATLLRFDYCLDPEVSLLDVQRGDTANVFFDNCVGMKVTRSVFRNARPSGLGYGVEFGNASCSGLVAHCTFDDVRHSLSTNNSVSTDFGIVRNIVFSHNHVRFSARSATVSSAFTVNTTTDVLTLTTPNALFSGGATVRVSSSGVMPVGVDSAQTYYTRVEATSGGDTTAVSLYLRRSDAMAGTNKVNLTSAGTGPHLIEVFPGGDAIDTHGGADLITIVGNTVEGASASGINVECPSCTVTDNTIIEPYAYGIYVHNESDVVGRAVIANNTILRPHAGGILLSQGTRGTPVAYSGFAVNGNIIEGAGQMNGLGAYPEGIVVRAVNSTMRAGTINGNTINGSNVGGIRLTDVRGVACNGNTIYNVGAEGIKAVDVLLSAFIGNVIHLASGSAFNGILVEGSTTGSSNYNKVAENIVTLTGGSGAAYGIKLDNECTNHSVQGNIITSFAGGDVDLGAGSGNTQANNT